MPDARIFDIQRTSFVDGPGIRTVVFFKGCNLRCRWCHNPESWKSEPQLMLYPSKCVGCGKCVAVCETGGVNDRGKCTACGACADACLHGARALCGRDESPRAILDGILRDKPFFDASGGGVTFTGGECLLQPDALYELASLCHESGVHTAMDTAGNVPFGVIERMLPVSDLFLYDMKCFSAELHAKYTGASNRRILANLFKLLALAPERVWVRVPLIPGFNDDEAELRLMKAWLDAAPNPPARVELLPYHRLGENKREAAGYSNDFAPEPPSAGQMERYRAIFDQ